MRRRTSETMTTTEKITAESRSRKNHRRVRSQGEILRRSGGGDEGGGGNLHWRGLERKRFEDKAFRQQVRI